MTVRTLTCLAMLCAPLAGLAQAVTVCVDNGPPPDTTPGAPAAAGARSEPTGFSAELARAAFAKIGRPVRFITDAPWSRCLKMVADGEVDFALGAYHDAERARRFAYSVRYQTLTPQVFYLRSRPLALKSTADLKRYRGCGMLGASYAHYDLAAADLDLGVNEYARLIDKLKAGRCDYFVEELEVIAGLTMPRPGVLADPLLQHGAVAGARAPTKHLISARDGSAARLLPELNASIEALIRSGKAAELWRNDSSGLPYQP